MSLYDLYLEQEAERRSDTATKKWEDTMTKTCSCKEDCEEDCEDECLCVCHRTMII